MILTGRKEAEGAKPSWWRWGSWRRRDPVAGRGAAQGWSTPSGCCWKQREPVMSNVPDPKGVAIVMCWRKPDMQIGDVLWDRIYQWWAMKTNTLQIQACLSLWIPTGRRGCVHVTLSPWRQRRGEEGGTQNQPWGNSFLLSRQHQEQPQFSVLSPPLAFLPPAHHSPAHAFLRFTEGLLLGSSDAPPRHRAVFVAPFIPINLSISHRLSHFF